MGVAAHHICCIPLYYKQISSPTTLKERRLYQSINTGSEGHGLHFRICLPCLDILFLETFYYQWMLNFVRTFLKASIDMMIFFLFQSNDMLNYID